MERNMTVQPGIEYDLTVSGVDLRAKVTSTRRDGTVRLKIKDGGHYAVTRYHYLTIDERQITKATPVRYTKTPKEIAEGKPLPVLEAEFADLAATTQALAQAAGALSIVEDDAEYAGMRKRIMERLATAVEQRKAAESALRAARLRLSA